MEEWAGLAGPRGPLRIGAAASLLMEREGAFQAAGAGLGWSTCPGAGLGGLWQAGFGGGAAGGRWLLINQDGPLWALWDGRRRAPCSWPAALSWQQMAQTPELILNLPGF